jgi:50S ribosomal subunit-associated GTPase HflX
MDEMEKAIDELEKATDQLVKVSARLAERTEELNQQLQKLVEGLRRRNEMHGRSRDHGAAELLGGSQVDGQYEEAEILAEVRKLLDGS